MNFKPLISFLACMAASATIVGIIQDPWFQGTIGAMTLIAILTIVIYAAHLWGLSDGIKIGQKGSGILYEIGLQTGKKWRGR